MKKRLYLILLILLLIPSNCFALNEVNIFFFHSETCDICKQEKIYLQALKDRYPNIRVHEYEINTDENDKLMNEAKKMYGETRAGVPFTIIADTTYHGFSEAVKGTMQNVIYKASYNNYENAFGKSLNIGYKTDLEGEVKEYKENSNYTIEEKGTEGVHPKAKEYNSNIKKYRSSIVLVSIGLFLAVIYLILKIKESRDNR